MSLLFIEKVESVLFTELIEVGVRDDGAFGREAGDCGGGGVGLP